MESTSNQPELTIRPVVQSDVPQIVKVIDVIWAVYGCVLDTSIEEQYLLTPGQYFHERNGEFWVVETRFTSARRLYERMGFVKTGLRRLDEINNTTEFGFSLSLG